MSVTRHPQDRVFIASIGTYQQPVADTWTASQRDHIWFTHPSQRVTLGDHLFVLAAGRRSAVIGLSK
ncbi:MAG: hypothetical protein ACLP0J_27615 [Solirubrobacteraceae bacterium]